MSISITESTKMQQTMFDVELYRRDFPILGQQVNGKPLVYFDNAATTQKPFQVIDTLLSYYTQINANIHRGNHYLADKATAAFEGTRNTAARFLNSRSNREIVFTKGVTDGLNLLAHSLGNYLLKPGKEVIVSGLEHHSNMVPWQMACERTGATLKVIPVLDNGTLDYAAFNSMLSENTAIVSVVYASNALGTINDVEHIIAKAHKFDAAVVIDGAQAASHLEVDVQALDMDFFVFSGHKLYGPTGVGVLYGKEAWLEKIPPYQGGGEMIGEVTLKGFTVNELPYKFEAGTPNIADVIALKPALEYITMVGKGNASAYEHQLNEYCIALLQSEIEGFQLIGAAPDKIGICSFGIEGIHPSDAGSLLDNYGVAVRTGHHCAQPLMQRFNIPGSIRASFAFYNTFEEIDIFVASLKKVVKMLR